LKVKKDIKPEYAAAIAVNPCTAYRLLNDFADLKPGTVIATLRPARTLEPAPVQRLVDEPSHGALRQCGMV
jgi:hypothetical protein